MLGDIHTVQEIVGSQSNFFDQSMSRDLKVLYCLRGNDALNLIEAKVSLNDICAKESENLSEKLLILSVFELIEALHAVA